MMKSVLGIVCLATVWLSVAPTVHGGYCSAYCDLDNYYQSAFYCTQPPDYYCCGGLNQRYCCSNSTQDITGTYPDVYWCENSSWWIFNWRVITVLLTTTLVILLCSAFCCKCCYRAEGRRGSDEIITISDHIGENGEGLPSNPVVFNPQSPYAFTPPDYSSLPKDPPKYYDLYAQQAAQGHFNHAYMVTDLQEVQMAPASSCEATHNDNAIPRVHCAENGEEQTEEGQQIPDDPPPSYREAEATASTAPGAMETVTMETRSNGEV